MDLGLQLRVDDIGNMYATRTGLDPTSLPVVIGSHLDTVTPGGRFDGILGVVVALETIALLNDAGISTQRPITVVNWTGEEGARFPPAMIGSGVVSGAWDVDFAYSRVDQDGVVLRGELDRIGYRGLRSNRLESFFAALELHIEQGTQLEVAGADIGIVPGIEPVRWCKVTVSGAGGHAGGPGPSGRRDSMVAASRMIVAARDASLISQDFRTTVGAVEVHPGSNNVIPSEVTFNLDIRSTDDARLEVLLERIQHRFESIAHDEGVEVGMETIWTMAGTTFNASLVTLMERCAEELHTNWRITPGSIGHDSVHLAAMGPTAMLFAPTDGGRSHCADESSPWESIVEAAKVFAQSTATLANTGELSDLAASVERQAAPL
jgi:N-carbamoyl-L-amino-acid hydrolase